MTGDVVVVANSGATVTQPNGWTYVDHPQVFEVSPLSGQRGTSIRLLGIRLFAGSDGIESVTLGGVRAILRSPITKNQISIEAPDAVPGEVDITLIAKSGATFKSPQKFTYISPGKIDSVDPRAGAANALVTIRGSSLLGGGSKFTSVTLAESSANILKYSDTEVIVSAHVCDGACTGVGSVRLTSDTGAVIEKSSSWKYSHIFSVEPSSGSLGTIVTIRGRGLFIDGSELAQVKFGSIDSFEIINASETEIYLRAGYSPSEAKDLDVTIISNSGSQFSKKFSWSYLSPSSIEVVSPTVGQHGTLVTINGRNFYRSSSHEVQRIDVAGQMQEIVRLSKTEIVVRVGTSVPKTGDITVHTMSGAFVTKPSAFTFLEGAVIEYLDLEEGQHGTFVTIHGQRLLVGAKKVVNVTLAGRPARIIDYNSTAILVRASQGFFVNETQGDVRVELDSGAHVILYNGWTYGKPGSISSVNPNIGFEGTRVTLTGSNLFGPSGTSVKNVYLSNIQASRIIFQNSSVIVVQAGSNKINGSSGLGNVVIESNTGATITFAGGWEYFEPGSIESVAPYSGQHMTTAVITGRNLLGLGKIVKVELAGVGAEIISQSDTTVVVRAGPRNESALGEVVVTSSTGAYVISSPEKTTAATGGFMYVPPGEFGGAFPPEGQCGTQVRLSGKGMLQGGNKFTKVNFGPDLADIVDQTEDYIVVRVPCK
jgi:hypothetical protein